VSGPVLICDGRVLPVSQDALTFLEAVEDRYTLAEVQRQYGDQALSFLGELSLHHFIGFSVADVA
jgi:hypothetical protein